jgi:phosphoglycerol transferase MdoB-like AlkP superfamily enzyme
MKTFFQNRPLRILGAAYLFIAVVLRVALWFAFGRPAGVAISHLPLLLGAGLLNDLVEGLYLGLPLGLLALLLPRRLTRQPSYRRLVAGGLFLALFGLLYLATVEYFFFAEFDSRFNLIAVDYLIYPTEVLVNIWESYPVARILLIEAILTLGLLRLLRPLLDAEEPVPVRQRGLRLFSHLGLLLIAATGFSTDTLAWSENRVANEISANGISSLFRAFRTNELDYGQYYRTIDDARAFTLVQHQLGTETGGTAGMPPSLTRTIPARAEGLGRMNVVVVVEESLGAGFVGAYGNQQHLTPNFDRLAGSGLLFSNAFATGTRTVRGLEAITASFPPIPSESIVKRPGCEKIANWGTAMSEQGYQTSFLYGGYSYFDNMQNFFAGNGFAIRDRSDIKDPAFANIWGVSDEDLFRDAIGYFDTLHQGGKPFFSVIMTTSNHTPFTFPDGIPGIPASGGGRKAGVRYADYALGQLFDEAPKHPWFANTLFVIVADHDARVYGRAQIPLEHYRIPLLVYAPEKLAAGTVAAPCSQMDIAPTVLGLLGFAYTAPFYGQDVVHQPDPRHPILLNHNHDVALLSGDRLVVLGLNRQVDTFRCNPDTGNLSPATADPALVDLATAYYQTAFELFRDHRYTPRSQAVALANSQKGDHRQFYQARPVNPLLVMLFGHRS